ncbi:hypothetical protein Tco_0201790 [Tanacetum coccineum]
MGKRVTKNKGRRGGPEWVSEACLRYVSTTFMLEMVFLHRRLGVTTRHPPYPTPSNMATVDNIDKTIEEEGPKGEETTTVQNEETLIHVSLPFLEAMIHMPKGAKVLKDLLSLKEKLEKAASSVKLSKECSTVIQRSLPQKEEELENFILPCLIGPLAVINAFTDLGAKNWVDTVDHDGKWIETEEKLNPEEIRAVSFYPRKEKIEPLEWKAPKNRLKPSITEPPKLELKELSEHLECLSTRE